MRYATKLLLTALALPLALSTAEAQVSDPAPGACRLGTAQRDLDVNNVLARVFNTGSLFFGEGSQALYIVPRATATLPVPQSPIFASGIWIGGKVNGQARVAGSRYANFEFWPGPLDDATTRPVNPGDCAEYDRIWKVSREDIDNFAVTGVATPDLATWPADLGAPVIAAPNNGVDDDGDGLVDEGTDGVDNDGDGFVDERDEQERRIDGGYNLAAGDRPDIIGDQAVWWVMNDVGNTHQETNSAPLGVEVQVLAWAFNRSDVLGDATFYRYTVISHNASPITEAYLSVFSDPDLGDAADDYVGSDTTLSLGFVYNGRPVDNVYGTPPATGYDFFQGPIVDLDGDGVRDDTLGLTRYSYFQNVPDPSVSDPSTLDQYYNYMQGLWGDGTPMTAAGNGYQTNGEITKFAFPGDPVTAQDWSEVAEDNPPGDRRFVVTTGPFTLEPFVPQSIVFGIVHAQGGSYLNSISALRVADDIAQTAYDIDFELAQPAPNPPRCNPNANIPELRPGSGSCAEVVELNGKAAIVWGYPTFSPNYRGSYEVIDRLIAGRPGIQDETYNFEGFNIYRYPTSQFLNDQRELVATFDLVNDITTIIDTTRNAQGLEVPFIAASGTDSGLEYVYVLPDNLTNYTDYYYGLTTYSYNEESTPDVIESAPLTFTIRPADIAAGNGGQVPGADLGDVLTFEPTPETLSRVGISVEVVDPTAITGATYRVRYYSHTPSDTTLAPAVVYDVLRGNQVVFNGGEAYELTGEAPGIADANVVIDGLDFYALTAPGLPAGAPAGIVGAGDGIIEVSYAGDTDVCPGIEDSDDGCSQGLGGNTVWRPSVNSDGSYAIGSNVTYAEPGRPATLTTSSGIYRYIETAAPDDFEMRFTQEGGLGFYGLGGNTIASVPFEIWNIKDPENPDDDIRMIPALVNPTGCPENPNWVDTRSCDANIDPRTGQPSWDLVYWYMPDRPNGYELFEQAALGFGGPGAVYDRDNDGDTQIDISGLTGQPCMDRNSNTPQQGGYIDWCYREEVLTGYYAGGEAFLGSVYPIGRFNVIDVDEDGEPPPPGTTIRIQTVGLPQAGNEFILDTSPFAVVAGVDSTAQNAMERITAVPNPYIARSAYETGNLDRVMRFTNLPDRATIRIYTVAGTLIKELFHTGGRSTDWDLTTINNLPVASGMYLVHIEGRRADDSVIGETVLKVGVVNRQTQVDVF